MVAAPLRPPLCIGPQAYVLIAIPGNQERVFAEATLAMAGFHVRVTRSFRRARSLLLTDPPAMLMTDIGSGRRNGLGLARLARALTPHVPLLLTADRMDPQLQHAVEGLGAAFVWAPLTEDRLLAALYRTVLREPNADGSLVSPRRVPIPCHPHADEPLRLTRVCSSVM